MGLAQAQTQPTATANGKHISRSLFRFKKYFDRKHFPFIRKNFSHGEKNYNAARIY